MQCVERELQEIQLSVRDVRDGFTQEVFWSEGITK